MSAPQEWVTGEASRFSLRGGRYFLTIILGFIVFNLLWHGASVIMQLEALPSPLPVYLDWSKALSKGILMHSLSSLGRVLIIIAIALALALIIAIPMGMNRFINSCFGPLFYFSYPIPKLALLPVVMILLGIGDAAKITVIVLIIVFQLIIAMRDAIRNIPNENYALLTALGATTWEKFRHITLPATLPTMLSSIRISIGIALSALFFTETFGTTYGLGFYITDCWMRRDYLQMYFGIAILAFIGLALFIVLDVLERVLCRWNDNSRN